MLEVEGEGVCTMVYVLRGVPVFAEEGTLGETLGRILLREKELTEEQYHRIIEHMTSSVMGAEQMRFGEVAVTLGFLTPEQVNEALAKQVRRKVQRCIEWEAAECVFREGAEELEGIARYPCPVEPLVLRTVRHSFDEARVARMLEGAASCYPELAEPGEQLSQRFKLDPAGAAFLETIDGTRTAFQLIYSAPLDGMHASQILSVLIVADAVRLRDEPAAALVPIKDAAQAVQGEVAAQVSEQKGEARPAAREPVGVLVRGPGAHQRAAPDERAPTSVPGGVSALRGHGDEVHKPVSEAVRAAARHRLARRLGLRGTRTDPKAVTPPPAKLGAAPKEDKPRASKSLPPAAKQARLRAEQLFQSGKVHVRNERWPLALSDLSEAVRLYPSASEYLLYAEWAKFQTLTDAGETEAMRDKLEELAIQALKQDKGMAFAHHVLGQVKLMQGDEKKALRAFKIATKLDPDDRAAARYYRMLSRKRG